MSLSETARRYEHALRKIALRSKDRTASRIARRALDPEAHAQAQQETFAKQREVREKKRRVLNSIGANALWYTTSKMWVRPVPHGVNREEIVKVRVVKLTVDPRSTTFVVGEMIEIHVGNLVPMDEAITWGVAPP